MKHKNYYDCQICKHEFGKSNACYNCNYYEDCMIELEISKMELAQDKALDRLLSRLEDGEHI